MFYTPNMFTASMLCFPVQLKSKEQQQWIYFSKFCNEIRWGNVKSKGLGDNLQKNVQNRKICESFCLLSMILSINITYAEQFCILTYKF